MAANTAGGPAGEQARLVDALKTHRFFGAGLDVFEREPQVHPGLIASHHAVLAPHIASASTRTRSEMCAMAARNSLSSSKRRPISTINSAVATTLGSAFEHVGQPKYTRR